MPRWFATLLLVGCAPSKDDSAVALHDLDGDGVDAPEDCDDGDRTVLPGADEVCNARDDDCDGEADEDAVDAATLTYDDLDGDTYGDPATGVVACAASGGRVLDVTDCNDAHANVHPGADERCNSVDDDCDEETDEDPIDGHDYQVDADLDNYGDPMRTEARCRLTAGVTTDTTDCDDTRADVHPEAQEACDGVDNDCDTEIDEDAWDQHAWYEDEDGDNYGVSGQSVAYGCTGPEGTTSLSGDCDDADPDRSPGHPELCDGFDNDCSGGTTDAYTATYFPDGGEPVDLVAALAAGGEGAPVPYAVSGGAFNLCGVTLYVNLTVTGSTTFGRYWGSGVLSGGGVGTVLAVVGDGLEVSMADYDILDGDANVLDPVTGALAGGGLACIGASTVTLSNVDFDASSADLGGNIYSSGCTVSLSNGYVEDGSATFGGGIFAQGGAIHLEDVVIQGSYGSATGGGIVVQGDLSPTTLELVDTKVKYNVASDGGGLALYRDVAVTCTATTPSAGGFMGNTARGVGGGVLLEAAGGDASFASLGCDFAEEGISDNLPTDMWLEDLGTSYTVGDAATFLCTGTGCG